MSDLDRLQRQLGEWAAKVFPGSTEGTVLAHLRAEVNEELHAGCELDELADVAILLCQLATKRGASLYDLMVSKSAVNYARKWAPDTGRGFREHVREE